MNEETAKAGIAVAHLFIETFNAQDHEGHAKTLNYPHVRFANGRISTIENAEVFIAGSRRGEGRLQQEGWHHTTVANLDVIHSGDDKVHLALRNDRCREDGSVYHSFDTFWIATLVDDHWGIQFRSSFPARQQIGGS